MTRYIDADGLLEELKLSSNTHAENSRDFSLLHRDIVIVKEQPTVDAVPVEFIEAEIKRMEYEIEHALIKYKHADGTIERMIARKAALEFILAKWEVKREEE